MQINLMSYNVLHCEDITTSQVDYDRCAQTILESGADIVGLNEIYEGQERALADRLGFDARFAFGYMEDGMPFGNGILSRYPIQNAVTVPIPNPDPPQYDGYYEPRCVLACEIAMPDGTLTVNVTHFGLNPDEQINAVQTLLPLQKEERYVLMGDFNVLPENDVLLPLRERLQDTAAMLHGNGFTFPSKKPTRQIDYIFTSRDLRVMQAAVPEYIVSDHRPMTAAVR